MACVVAAPIAAGHGGRADEIAANPGLQQALEVRAQVEQVNDQARENAPDAVGAHCNATLDVEGIGNTCVTENGLLRVEQADGRSATIHGVDAPPLGSADSFAPASQTAVNGASVANINCVDATQPHYTLVYARPGDAASRYTTIAPLLRTEVYKVSAYVDAETRAVDPTASRKLPVLCDAGTPVVRQAALASLTSGTASFGQIVDAFRAQGYEFNNDQTGLERYIVYYDTSSPTGAAGTGHVFTNDSTGAATNQNNKGGLYAIEYRFDGGGGAPHWEVLIHETFHTMGGVVSDAPHASAAGHCTDGQDILCYQDTDTTPYNPSVCSTKVLDCGRNDYFNPAPAAGSFLATHWNTAATYNRFLVAGVATGGTDGSVRTPNGADGDVTPPATPTGLRARQVGGRITFTWTAASDDVAVTRYDLRKLGATGISASSTGTSTSLVTRGLRVGALQTFELIARDAASNSSTAARVTLRVARDTVRPTLPTRLRVAARTSSTLTLAWNPSRDEAGIRGYVVSQKVGRRWVRLSTLGANTRSVRIVRLHAHSAYTFHVEALDLSGNRSIASAALAARTR
jgi:hypothetical protein